MKNSFRALGLLLLLFLVGRTQDVVASTGITCSVCRVHCGDNSFARRYNISLEDCCALIASFCGAAGGSGVCEVPSGPPHENCPAVPGTGA